MRAPSSSPAAASESRHGSVLGGLQRVYQWALAKTLRQPWPVLAAATALVLGTGALAPRLGAEFVPTLDEGDVLIEVRLAGICNTDLELLRGYMGFSGIAGHEFVGRVIEAYANRFGYNVVRDFTGHGIGTTFHNGLVVLHHDQPSVTTIIQPGMVFTIEPMINLGALDYEIWDDGWTVVTKDRKWTAQFEHTLAVTDTGVEILTLP